MTSPHRPRLRSSLGIFWGLFLLVASPGISWAQLTDRTLAPNNAQAGIAKSLGQETGVGRGDPDTLDSSLFIIERDPFRSIRRGRQLFQRKFRRVEGQGPGVGDGAGDLNTDGAIGAGLADSCAACHSRPRGSAGLGGNVATRPDSRDAPHLFGLGLKEMLADEITAELRNTRQRAIDRAVQTGRAVTVPLRGKGVHYGAITAMPSGEVDTSKVEGIDSDLRVKPFFAEGSVISIREFIVGALHKEMGLECNDEDLAQAHAGQTVVTPSGMVLDGAQDEINGPPPPDVISGQYEIDPAIVDHLEFYLLNYFKPGLGRRDAVTEHGRRVFNNLGCISCHVANLQINHDRRVADVTTLYDPAQGIFNKLFATANTLISVIDDGKGLPPLKQPLGGKFPVENIFTDFKRHDLGPHFYERNYDGTLQKMFLTRALWGAGSKSIFGHDGRSISLDDVILRHGGEAQASRDAYALLPDGEQGALENFLRSLVLFPPDDTASNLDPGDRNSPDFPQFGHGSIKLTVLFNDPTDPE
ncbi:MAG: thiol oxidoreductase-like protein [Chthoniobacterales bacterium]|nr:thiol oxidoreductase-like protein [Chthoniobacterales bacterium]